MIKISYNLLARSTARSARYKLLIDVFSGVIGTWTLANLVVIAVSLARVSAPRVRAINAQNTLSRIWVIQLLTFAESLLLDLRRYLDLDNRGSACCISLDHLGDQSASESQDTLVNYDGHIRSVSQLEHDGHFR